MTGTAVQETDSKATSVVDAVVVGAGFAGLYMVHRLRDELDLSVRGFETGGGVGGTWYWNRYPGARTDSPYSAYGFSFSDEIAEQWAWSERYPGQQEVLKYLEFVTDHFDLRRSFTFDTRIVSATWSDDTSRWVVTTDAGETLEATYVVTAIGLLSAPNVPPFPGIEKFQGVTLHPASWPAEGLDLHGKRVGLIGTGSTGIQVLTSIVDDAETVTVFQRTPNYVVPSHNRPLTVQEQDDLKQRHAEVARTIREHPFAMPFVGSGKNAMDVDDQARDAIYEEAWAKGGFHFLFESFDDLSLDEKANETACEFIRNKIRDTVDDPATAELLSPRGYPYGSKRPPAGNGYYEAFNRDNVRLVDVGADPIAEITETGVRTAEGKDFDFDVIIFATGFDASTGSFDRIDIRGRDGLRLVDKWSDGPLTNLGFSSAGFPNLLMVTGPLSPFANIPTCIEETVDWIHDAIEYLRAHSKSTIEAEPDAERAWATHVTEVANFILAARGEAVNTWFAGANIEGKTHAINVYFGGANAYFDACRAAAADGYRGFAVR